MTEATERPARPPVHRRAQPPLQRCRVRARHRHGKERNDVAEYCISEGWVKVPTSKTVDRKGNPVLIKLKGTVESFYR